MFLPQLSHFCTNLPAMRCPTRPIPIDTEVAKGMKIVANCIPRDIASFIGIILPLCYDVASRR